VVKRVSIETQKEKRRLRKPDSSRVSFLLPILIFAAGSVRAQLVTNGGFENTMPGPVTGNDIEGWVLIVDANVSPAPDFEIVNDMVQEGNRALKIGVHAIGQNAWDIQAVADSIPVKPGATYRYSIWAKSQNPGAQVNFTVGNYAYNEYGVIRPATLSSQWQKFTFDFTVTDQEIYARAPVHFGIAANIGNSIYMDDLQIILSSGIWEGPPLASGHSKFLGCAYSTTQAPNFVSYWNQVTPENAGKWGSVEGTRDAMTWNSLDVAYKLAKDNGFPFRFHVLIWGNQQPAWIESLPPNEQLSEIEEWFSAVAERYPDIDYLEVVNEPLHDPPNSPGNGGGNYIEALGGSNGLYGTGWDWVIKAFELARQYFPDSTKLMINDYNIVRSSSNTAAYLTIIHLLQERGLIDGIGFQAHGSQVNTTPATTIRENMNSLAATGLFLQVTEMDVDGQTDQQQVAEFQRVFLIFWEHPAVVGVTLWGWRPVMYNTTGNLVNNDGTERPALVWLRDYVHSTIVSLGEPRFETPQTFSLSNNYPNPFNPSTQIAYSIPQNAHISIMVYNLLGEEVATLFDGVRTPGNYSATFDGRGCASGVYMCRLQARSGDGEPVPVGSEQSFDFVRTRKLLLLR
jgi:GH35 family endo-1,4-beta-xylanase